ncbi:MAG: pyruvate dehydrogenase complex dihydrolipoamide acetyltransferase [Alphaproteobacteria bacterium]
MPITVTMPALSPTMTEGTLTSWLVKEGDTVAAGDILAEIETDKATMEVEAVDEGTVGKLLVDAGTEGVPVNQAILVMLEDGEDDSALESYEPESGPAPQGEGGEAKSDDAPKAKSEAPKQEQSKSEKPAGNGKAVKDDGKPAPAAPKTDDGERIKASPLARRMAAQAKLELADLKGSGPHGRIVKADIEAALKGGAPKKATADKPAAGQKAPSAPPSGYEPPYDEKPLSQMRKTIARRMSESKQTAPHFYLTIDCEIDALLDLRKQLNGRADGDEFKLSVNDLIIKGAALALMKVPVANVAYVDGNLRSYKNADIAVAVATPGGLITPVVRRAEQKGLMTISNEMKELAAKARDGKLQPEEYLGGTFTISNLGMFGVKAFDAVLNPPQACILAVGAGEQRPVVADGAVAIATVMSCTLSVDHRAVDGAIGAQYLAAFKALIEDPMAMML